MKRGQPVVRSSEEKAAIDTILQKFSKLSFGDTRKSLLSALHRLISEPTDLTNANTVIRQIENFLQLEPTATPTEIIRNLQEWINTAKLDEGSFASSRVFTRKIMDLFVNNIGSLAIAMADEEIKKSLNPPQPGSNENIALAQTNLTEFTDKIRTLEATIVTLRSEKEGIEKNHTLDVQRIEGTNKLATDRLNDQIAALKAKVGELEPQHQSQSKQITELSSTIQEQLRMIDKLTHTISSLELLRDTLRDEAKKWQDKYDAVLAENKKLASENAASKATFDSNSALIKKLQEENAQLGSRATSAESESKKQHDELIKLTSELATLKAQLAQSVEKTKTLESDLSQARQQADIDHKKISELSVINSRLTTESEGAQASRDEALRDKAKYERELAQIRSEYSQVRDEKEHIAVAKGQVEGELKATKETKDDLIQRGERTLQALALTQQKAKQQETHLLEAGKVINTLTHKVAESVPEEQRVTVLEESLADASEAGIAALGLERNTILKQATGKKANAGAQKAPGQSGMFKAPAPTASTNGAPKKELSPAEALAQARQKCVTSGMSETRFNAIEGIAKFIVKHLTNEKGLLKANASQDLLTKLVQATKTLAGPESTPIATVYQSLVDSKPGDKDPLFNDYNAMLISFAVEEPKSENLQNKSIFYNLTNHVFGKTYFIKELNTHFGGIYQHLNMKKADTTASVPLLDKTGIENTQKDTSFLNM